MSTKAINWEEEGGWGGGGETLCHEATQAYMCYLTPAVDRVTNWGPTIWEMYSDWLRQKDKNARCRVPAFIPAPPPLFFLSARSCWHSFLQQIFCPHAHFTMLHAKHKYTSDFHEVLAIQDTLFIMKMTSRTHAVCKIQSMTSKPVELLLFFWCECLSWKKYY